MQQPKQPNTDWRYSASLRAGMQSSVILEESGVLRGGPTGPTQQWPTTSSATTDPEGGDVSPPVGAGVNSNSWTFKYGPANPQQQQQHQHPHQHPQQPLQQHPQQVVHQPPPPQPPMAAAAVATAAVEFPENFIIPGSPAIISIRQDNPTNSEDKSDFITFGKKEDTKKKKKKRKEKGTKSLDKKEKGNSSAENDH
ncbi:protocadherin alpha-4-like [Protopterus annectens]|uniref:protocadherin alpha-4-like n=1 Tax=Protopterus annectens TaxID=7888 RepID=UPI001CFC185B|nr:protocadherin alpha-4-like [Protopterus annectens]